MTTCRPTMPPLLLLLSSRCRSAVLLAAIFLRCQCLAFASPIPSRRPLASGWSVSLLSAAKSEASNSNDDVAQQMEKPLDLQSQHPITSPSQTLRNLAQFCEDNAVEKFDVYGDFDSTQDTSYLRKFESEVATAFGKDDGVFMPSGVMAQSIALLIHSKDSESGDGSLVREGSSSRRRKTSFACHRTSHLLLHEQNGYSKLLNMDAVILPMNSRPCGGPIGGSFGVQPLRSIDVEEAIQAHVTDNAEQSDLSTVMIELPHREIGGKLTPWEEVAQMSDLCREHDVAFHCDGARIFEAAAGYNLTLPQIAEPFGSVYISFYKGLGGLQGAMLLGDVAFCNDARLWLRRFGGNLYTLLPYAVSAWSGFRVSGLEEGGGPTFSDKKDKIRQIVCALVDDEEISGIVTFDPTVPLTNMVHGFIRASLEDCKSAIEKIAKRMGLSVLSRIRAISDTEEEFKRGYGCRFEWTIGDANAAIDDEIFLETWKAFTIELADNED